MKKYKCFVSEKFRFLEVKFSIYLNRRVSVMGKPSSAYGWSGGFSPSSPAFALL